MTPESILLCLLLVLLFLLSLELLSPILLATSVAGLEALALPIIAEDFNARRLFAVVAFLNY
jgi:hypothetical protein